MFCSLCFRIRVYSIQWLQLFTTFILQLLSPGINKNPSYRPSPFSSVQSKLSNQWTWTGTGTGTGRVKGVTEGWRLWAGRVLGLAIATRSSRLGHTHPMWHRFRLGGVWAVRQSPGEGWLILKWKERNGLPSTRFTRWKVKSRLLWGEGSAGSRTSALRSYMDTSWNYRRLWFLHVGCTVMSCGSWWWCGGQRCCWKLVSTGVDFF